MSKIKIIIYIDRFTTAIVLIVGTNQLTPNNYPRNAFLEDFLVKFHIFSACGANKYTISVRTTVFSPGPYATGGIFIWSTQQIDRSDRNTWKSTLPQKNYGAQVSCLYLYWRPSEGRNGRTCWGNERDPNPPKICRVRATIYNNFLKKFQKTTLHESKL